jgi:hypothetical protein
MTILRLLVLIALGTGPALAGGDLLYDGKSGHGRRGGYGDKGAGFADGPALFARGCYWRRGERYCSAYCYEEINGNRYCNTRESEAVPQGDPARPMRPTLEDVYRPRRDDR